MTLARLIDAVEAGSRGDDFWSAVHVLPAMHITDVTLARDGSLDAAKRLHDALLPGWWWSIGTCKVSDDARVAPHDDSRAPDGREWADYTDVDLRPSGNPARAFLLAILRAMEGRDG